ncbi:hypothetical protein CXG47_24370 [Pseudomonas plecoglossicida]|uniref:Uncharacterized protein n=1 Tax=Pseudomonas plecoglossicida TaxID=70775 RepID=A0ABX4TYA1_PSEDL|nr:hypothetical protein CXG47_24370 [Pseudomonas plecoglossicida]
MSHVLQRFTGKRQQLIYKLLSAMLVFSRHVEQGSFALQDSQGRYNAIQTRFQRVERPTNGGFGGYTNIAHGF